MEKLLTKDEVRINQDYRGPSKVEINSEVTVLMKYAEDDEEEVTFTLVGDNGDAGLSKVSIKSPIAKCIYDKEEGFEGKYSVKESTISVKILRINNK